MLTDIFIDWLKNDDNRLINNELLLDFEENNACMIVGLDLVVRFNNGEKIIIRSPGPRGISDFWEDVPLEN